VKECAHGLSFCLPSEYDCIKNVADYCSESESKTTLEQQLAVLIELGPTLQYLPGEIMRTLRTELQTFIDMANTKAEKTESDITGLGKRIDKADGDITELGKRLEDLQKDTAVQLARVRSQEIGTEQA
jgi:hypothetical protein